jgi:hypothetical protein
VAIMATDSGNGTSFPPVPTGNHRGVCVLLADLGNQRVQSQMYGEKVKHQVYVAWELPDETLEWTDKDGNEKSGPRWIGKTYTVSLHENANLRADLESWRGRPFTEEERKGFDITKLIGVPALINVTHEVKGPKTYANVTAVTPLPKGMDKPTPTGATTVYDADNVSSFDDLPEWLQKKIQDQVVQNEDDPPEQRGAAFDTDLDDDVPF